MEKLLRTRYFSDVFIIIRYSSNVKNKVLTGNTNRPNCMNSVPREKYKCWNSVALGNELCSHLFGTKVFLQSCSRVGFGGSPDRESRWEKSREFRGLS